MIAYTMLGTNDPKRARAFYEPLMAALGAKVVDAYTSETRTWFGKGGAGMLAVGAPGDGKAATAGNGTMISIAADSQAQVADVHAKALAAGASNEGDPGMRTAPFYGAYFRDHDGNKVCIFTMGS
ncbi:MAG: VOC family protein [Hyphomonadaceae bacterium]|nr:MAG: lactoylglutathione lyase [Caulobacteraceae bacterium]MBT9446344.1 VOC family protein [Hyphomonadaceae bacterium]